MQLDLCNPLIGKTISHATLKTEDIWSAIKDAGLDMKIPADVAAYAEETIHANPESIESMEALDAVYDSLTVIAPDGYYFGAHEGDGSDFGFWEDPSYLDDITAEYDKYGEKELE